MIDSIAVVGKLAVIAAKGHCLRKFHLMGKSFSSFFKTGSPRACEIQAEGNFGRELAWADSSFSINMMLWGKNTLFKHKLHVSAEKDRKISSVSNIYIIIYI